MIGDRFYGFYFWMFFLPILPYVAFVVPFVPETIGSFNLSGWLWVVMFLVALYYLTQQERFLFPVYLWLPWVIFLLGYLLFDFSVPGLQLTAQYLLPLLVGIVASGFSYSKENLHWLYKSLLFPTFIIVCVVAYGHLLKGGWTPMTAYTPMFLSVVAAISIGVFFLSGKSIFLLFFILLFFVPFLDVTRMGMLVFLIILIFHFANKKFFLKIAFLFFGLIAIIIVFNSKGFQEKTFYSGRGDFSDISLNYYDESNEVMNTSGRSNFFQFYEKGLKDAPLFGNGPRADMYALKSVWGGAGVSEAHNDYLAVRYNYGYVGMFLLLFGFISSFMSVYVKYRNENNGYKVLVQSTFMILTLTFLAYMYSDNILKSTVFFADFYFALLGIAFADFNE